MLKIKRFFRNILLIFVRVEKVEFHTDEEGNCTDMCNELYDGTMVGSVYCAYLCKHRYKFSQKQKYVKCPALNRKLKMNGKTKG